MISAQKTVSDLVVERPGRSRLFEEVGIDYCCGGGVPLEQACGAAGVELETVLEELARREAEPQTGPDFTGMALGELVDHVVRTHHDYLRAELPRLSFLVEKVAGAHGTEHPELYELRSVFERLRTELEEHTSREERVLFPACRKLEETATMPDFPFGSVENPIAAMMAEHVDSGEGLRRIRELTWDYDLPKDACNSYRAMLDGLAELERDTHYHVFKENSILFPKAAAAEVALIKKS
ncbi:MAG: iron-sulfur cluster repair di-iron protein [Rubrobacter sp.]|nr:iron-sulfur cluster repair di-iron protein [Rubrobacter sp.]